MSEPLDWREAAARAATLLFPLDPEGVMVFAARAEEQADGTVMAHLTTASSGGSSSMGVPMAEIADRSHRRGVSRAGFMDDGHWRHGAASHADLTLEQTELLVSWARRELYGVKLEAGPRKRLSALAA